MWARVSTLFTSVAWPPTPRSKGRGGTYTGTAGPPLRKFTSADSSLATKPPGTATTRTAASARPACPAFRHRGQQPVDPPGNRAVDAQIGGGRADRTSGQRDPVEHQMRGLAQQDGVLPARGLGLGPVGDQHRAAAPPPAPVRPGDGPHLAGGGEGRAAPPGQAGPLHLRRSARPGRAPQQAPPGPAACGRAGAGRERAVAAEVGLQSERRPGRDQPGQLGRGRAWAGGPGAAHRGHDVVQDEPAARAAGARPASRPSRPWAWNRSRAPNRSRAWWPVWAWVRAGSPACSDQPGRSGPDTSQAPPAISTTDQRDGAGHPDPRMRGPAVGEPPPGQARDRHHARGA